MNKQETMLKGVAGLYGWIIAIVAFGALIILSQYYVWKVLPALDNVRSYELEREMGLLP